MAAVSLLSTDAGDAVVSTFALTRGVTVFGRDDDCDVILDDVHCSRRHLEIHSTGDACVLRDLGSTNGVLLNGQRVVADCQLREGDVIELGMTRLRFESDRVAAEPPATAVLPAIDTDDVPAEVFSRPVPRGRPRSARLQNTPAVVVMAALAAAIAGLGVQAVFRSAPGSSVRSGGNQSGGARAKHAAADRDAADEATTDVAEFPHSPAAPGRSTTLPRLPTRSADSRGGQTSPTRGPSLPAGPATLENLLEQVPAERPAAVSPAAAPRVDTQAAAPRPPAARPAAQPDGLSADAAAVVAAAPSGASPPNLPADPRRVGGPPRDLESPAGGGAAERRAVPPDDEVELEMRAIKKTFGDNFSGRSDLARVLAKIRSADRDSDNPAKTFALLVTAEREAIEAQLYRDAIACLRHRAELFDVDELPARIDLLRDASEGIAGPSADVFDLVVEAAVEAVRAERFDVAIKAASLAEGLADAIEQATRQHVMAEQSAGVRVQSGLPHGGAAPATALPSGMDDLADAGRRVAIAKNLRKRIHESKRLRAKYVEAAEELRESPHDKSAAEVVGKYLCFVKQDWPAGLPALAMGRSTALGELASRELTLSADEAADPTPAFDVAGEWWTFAERGVRASGLPAGSAEIIRSHAAGIYERILDRLTDPVDAALAENRVAAAKPSAESDDEDREFAAP
jgi:hypothetical protein